MLHSKVTPNMSVWHYPGLILLYAQKYQLYVNIFMGEKNYQKISENWWSKRALIMKSLDIAQNILIKN